jgi:hypothetical protein
MPAKRSGLSSGLDEAENGEERGHGEASLLFHVLPQI